MLRCDCHLGSLTSCPLPRSFQVVKITARDGDEAPLFSLYTSRMSTAMSVKQHGQAKTFPPGLTEDHPHGESISQMDLWQPSAW